MFNRGTKIQKKIDEIISLYIRNIKFFLLFIIFYDMGLLKTLISLCLQEKNSHKKIKSFF